MNKKQNTKPSKKSRRRNESITIRCTSIEKKMIQNLSILENMNQTDLILSAVKNKNKQVVYDTSIAEAMVLLQEAANYISENYGIDMELQERMVKLWEMLS